jgi:hypothetical protein
MKPLNVQSFPASCTFPTPLRSKYFLSTLFSYILQPIRIPGWEIATLFDGFCEVVKMVMDYESRI